MGRRKIDEDKKKVIAAFKITKDQKEKIKTIGNGSVSKGLEAILIKYEKLESLYIAEEAELRKQCARLAYVYEISEKQAKLGNKEELEKSIREQKETSIRILIQYEKLGFNAKTDLKELMQFFSDRKYFSYVSSVARLI